MENDRGTIQENKMSISTSRLSYQDCIEFMDKAMEDDKGARIIFGIRDNATFFRMRCHTARQINRKDNRLIYSAGDPLYDASMYDKLVFRIREDEDGKFWVYAEKTELDPGTVELLSGLEG